MVCLPTPARAAMASTLTLAYPLSRHSESAAWRMAARELSLRREASGFLVDVGTYLRVAEDETVRLVTGAHSPVKHSPAGNPGRPGPYWPAVNEAVTRGNAIGWPGRAQGRLPATTAALSR
jgi:hypothetical protein